VARQGRQMEVAGMAGAEVGRRGGAQAEARGRGDRSGGGGGGVVKG